jgi:hypothetical protein
MAALVTLIRSAGFPLFSLKPVDRRKYEGKQMSNWINELLVQTQKNELAAGTASPLDLEGTEVPEPQEKNC